MNTRTLATILGTALSATTMALQANPTSAQTAFGYASYYVQHSFGVNFGGNAPNLLGAVAFGNDLCFNPFTSATYFDSDIAFPSVTAAGAAGVFCQGASAESSSIATGSVAGNVLTGTTLAKGYAFAFAPPGGFARARSAAALTAGQLGINPRGQIFWRPLFWSYVSGEGSAFAAIPRLRDPIAYTITDPTTGDTLLQGNLLDISAEFDGFGSSLEWGFLGSPDSGNSGNESPAPDDNLNINFLNSGLFKIDLTDPAVSNPGLLDLACERGLVTASIASGRFSGVTLPSVGTSCATSIPLSLLNLDSNYDFTGLIPTSEVNLGFDLGGDGEAVASVPEPTSTLSILSLGILGAGATIKCKVKRSHSTEKEPSNVG
jgi:hypothetical protein